MKEFWEKHKRKVAIEIIIAAICVVISVIIGESEDDYHKREQYTNIIWFLAYPVRLSIYLLIWAVKTIKK